MNPTQQSVYDAATKSAQSTAKTIGGAYTPQAGLTTQSALQGQVQQNPSMAYDSNLIQAYAASGGALSNGAIPKVQPTTMSSANVQEYNQQNATSLANFPQAGSQTGQDGFKRYSDGSFAEAPEGAIANGDGTYSYNGVGYAAGPSSATNAYDKQINDLISSMRSELDANTKSTIDSIHSQYQNLIKQQERINAGANAGTNTLLIRGGSMHTGSGEGILQGQISFGLSQIGDLQSKENAAIGAARAAQAEGNFKLLDKQITLAKDIYEKKQETAQKLNEAVIKAKEENNKALAEQQKEDAKVAAQLSKDKNDLLFKLATNNAPLEVRQLVADAETYGEAIQAAGDSLYSENDRLDIQYKKAQIAKIYDDINSSGISGTDPSQIVAYANEYAANGKIPTGIPKDIFGIVAQVAKELPKTPGQILSASTGVTPTGDTNLQTGISSAYSAIELAKQLKELDELRVGGIISGSFGKVFGSGDQQRYVDLRSQVIDLLSRARSGAALTPSEEKRYGEMIPGRFSEPLGFGADSDIRIDNFINALSSDIKNKASSQGWAINGLSDVKAGGQIYKVGDVVTSPDGVQGRINADGSVTYLN